MSSDSTSAPARGGDGLGNTPGQVHRLKANSIGLIGVLFLSVATAAPITAMVGNVPIAIGFGNGAGAPAGYLVATIVLGLFAVGYASMAKHITSTGAFYGFVSQGLGQIPGWSVDCSRPWRTSFSRPRWSASSATLANHLYRICSTSM